MPISSRKIAKANLSKINSKGFLVRIKNRCVVTGKARGVLRKFTMSQTSLRMLARSGLVNGIKKASWLLFFSL